MPLVTVISPTTKFVVASLEVNVNAIDESLLVAPSDTVALVIVIVGAVESYVQLNCDAAVLLLPAASVNVAAPTSIEVAPSLVGVNVAEYTVELITANLLNEPPITVMSLSTKFVVASLDVNVKAIDESLLASPSETDELAIVIVGDVVSITKSAMIIDAAFPEESVTVTVLPLYVPSPNALNVMVLLPTEADADVENPSLMFVVIVPVSSLLKTKLGVVSLPGVATAVTAVSVGAVES